MWKLKNHAGLAHNWPISSPNSRLASRCFHWWQQRCLISAHKFRQETSFRTMSIVLWTDKWINLSGPIVVHLQDELQKCNLGIVHVKTLSIHIEQFHQIIKAVTVTGHGRVQVTALDFAFSIWTEDSRVIMRRILFHTFNGQVVHLLVINFTACQRNPSTHKHLIEICANENQFKINSFDFSGSKINGRNQGSTWASGTTLRHTDFVSSFLMQQVIGVNCWKKLKQMPITKYNCRYCIVANLHLPVQHIAKSSSSSVKKATCWHTSKY